MLISKVHCVDYADGIIPAIRQKTNKTKLSAAIVETGLGRLETAWWEERNTNDQLLLTSPVVFH